MALFVAVNAKFVHTSLSVRSLRNSAGENARIFECSINDSVTAVAEEIFKTGEKHILFSCYLWNIEMVLKVAEILKKADESIIISLGGPEVSFNAEKVLAENPYVSHIICGEGETKIAEFIKNPPERGIYDFGFVEDLDALPFPYNDGELTKIADRLVYYETQRGCPYNCAFCLSSAGKGVRFRSADIVKKEILEFIKNGVKLVKLVDRTFNADNKRAIELVEFIKENSQNTSFHFEVKAESMSDELIESLVSAKEGLFQLEIGVQSTDKDTLSAINRKENFEKLSEVVKKLSQNKGLHLHLDLIAGLPKENIEKYKKSFNDVYLLKPQDLQLGFLKKLHGAKITDKDGSFSSFPPYEVVKTDSMSYSEIVMLKGISAALERLYNSRAFGYTLKKLLNEFPTPFDMFYDLSSFFDFTKSISQKRLYEVMHEYDKAKFGGEKLKNDIIFDFCLSNRDYLSFMENDEKLKKDVFEFLKNEDVIEKVFPELKDIKPTERYKKLRFYKIDGKIFAFDSSKKSAKDVTEYFYKI